MNRRTLMLSVCFAWLAMDTSCIAEVYLTKDEAIRLVLGTGCEIRYEPRRLSDREREELKARGLLGVGDDTQTAHFFSCVEHGRITGRAVIGSEVGKHLPITYIVGLSPEGRVTRVEMMVFREVRGWEAKERRFMEQFEGKGREDELMIGRGIRNVTGATLSSQAIAKGVRRSLELWEMMYGSTRS
jgi:hypothetical protein